ncbi:MAG: Gfo/Idh/MocA family oxidoreductase [Planctomycetota bacterium]
MPSTRKPQTSPDARSKPSSNRREFANRREFVRTAAAAGTALSTPSIWTSGQLNAAGATSERTIAAIGVGGSRGRYNRGKTIAGQAAKLGRMIAVCDVDDLHNDEFNEAHGGKLNTYQDYRKLFDAETPDIVTIGTPDHWHIPIALQALESGADVYCEKPLTLTIEEGEIIQDAVNRTGKVFQVGTMQRSWNIFMYAVAIVQSGRLGSKVTAHCAIDPAPTGGPYATTKSPSDLDWDLWLGPTPKTDYSDERRRFFRWYLEYSGGKMTDWGAHHVDIAQWALGLDNKNIRHVSGTGQMTPIVPENFNWKRFLDGEIKLPNAYNSATEFNLELDFEGDKKITVNHEYESGTTKFGNGILFEGDKGRIFVNRGKLQGSAVQEIFGDNLEKKKTADGKYVDNYQECFRRMSDASRSEFDEAFVRLNKGKAISSHMSNFFECVEDRSEPMSDVASHVNSMNSLHMCNIALMLGRDLNWDAKAKNFGSDDQANALMSRKRRAGFELDT